MNARLLALALVVVSRSAACAAEKDSATPGPAPDGSYTPASGKADASGVDCVGADVETHAQLAWADLDGDGVEAYFPAAWPPPEPFPQTTPVPADFAPGAPDPGDLEDTIVCTWWCASYEDAPPIAPVATHDGAPLSVGLSLARRGGVWTPVQFYTWTPQCF
jgi:hypothetical protein